MSGPKLGVTRRAPLCVGSCSGHGLTIFVILLVLWLLGVVTSYTLGGFIHVLLIVAVILAVMQLIQGRRAL